MKSKNMKKQVLLCVVALLCTLSCGENIEEKAQALLNEAQTAYESKDYNCAKLLLDSLKSTYPKAFDARRAALKLGREVELGEQQRSVEFLDSSLTVQYALRDSLLPQFVLEKDRKYQDVGNYMAPSQTVKNNLGNTYLRAQVDENGVTTITSVYRGKAIGHTTVKVSSGDNYAECDAPFSKYNSKHLGVTTERVDYRYGEDSGLIDFIVNCESDIKVELSGNKSYNYNLRKSDVQAIKAVFKLSRILQNITTMKEMRDEAVRHIEFVEKTREKFENTSDTEK